MPALCAAVAKFLKCATKREAFDGVARRNEGALAQSDALDASSIIIRIVFGNIYVIIMPYLLMICLQNYDHIYGINKTTRHSLNYIPHVLFFCRFQIAYVS